MPDIQLVAGSDIQLEELDAPPRVAVHVAPGAFARPAINEDILQLLALLRVVVSDLGAMTGASEALVDAQGVSSTWAYNIRRRDLGLDSRVGSDGKGWMFEHPIRTTLFGRTLTLDDGDPVIIGRTHQGALLLVGTTADASYLLDFVANSAAGGITTVVAVRAGEYSVELQPSTGGDTLDGVVTAMTLAPGQMALLACSPDGWRSFRLGGTATLRTITLAEVGSVEGVPGRDLIFVSDYPVGVGSYWAPDVTGLLFRLGVSSGQQATEITAAQLRSTTPGAAQLYKVVDWPAGRGSYWEDHAGVLLPMGGCQVVDTRASRWTGTGTTGEQTAAVAEMCIGALVPGMRLRVRFGTWKTGTSDTLRARVRLGIDADGTYPNEDLIYTTPSTAQTDGFEFEWYVMSNTSMRLMMSQSALDSFAQWPASLSPDFTVPDLSANVTFLSVGIDITTGGGEVPTLTSFTVEILP